MKPVTRQTPEGEAHGSLMSYTVGFILSLLVTMVAYIFVYRHVNSGHELFSHENLKLVILLLAVTQLFVQLYFFLHMGRESKPRYNLILLSFAAMVVLIVVVGSLWIMSHLNYHQHGGPTDTNTYIIHDEGYH